jgi:Domain of unknown function (DUF4124)
MIRLSMTLLIILTAFSVSVSYAETYTWTDEQGTVHFTEDQGSVPEKFRNKVRILEDSDPPQEEQPASPAPSDKSPDVTLQAPPISKEGKAAPAENYAGKTYTQWEKDFRDREAAMTAVRERIVDISAILLNPKTAKDEWKTLKAEDSSLRAQFSEMKAQYNDQVEIARKAGLNINIQK